MSAKTAVQTIGRRRRRAAPRFDCHSFEQKSGRVSYTIPLSRPSPQKVRGVTVVGHPCRAFGGTRAPGPRQSDATTPTTMMSRPCSSCATVRQHAPPPRPSSLIVFISFSVLARGTTTGLRRTSFRPDFYFLARSGRLRVHFCPVCPRRRVGDVGVSS